MKNGKMCPIFVASIAGTIVIEGFFEGPANTHLMALGGNRFPAPGMCMVD